MNGPALSGASVIDIWEWCLDLDGQQIPGAESVLAEDERTRASQYYKARDGDRFIVGRGMLRHILGRCLGRPASSLVFTANDFGKPEIAGTIGAPLYFNLSHSADRAVLAVSERFQLGVDIEEIKPLKEDIAGRFFSSAECADLTAYSGTGYLEAFYRCWTRKEAFVKAHGAGLSLPLDSFDVTVDADRPPRLERLDGVADAGQRWTMFALAAPDGFVSSLVAKTEGLPAQVRYRDIRDISLA